MQCSSRLSRRYQWVDLFHEDGHQHLMQSLNLRAASLGPTIAPGLVTAQSHPRGSRSPKIVIPLIGGSCLLMVAAIIVMGTMLSPSLVRYFTTPTWTLSPTSTVTPTPQSTATLQSGSFKKPLIEVDLSSPLVRFFRVSPNSRRLALIAENAKGLTVVVDGHADDVSYNTITNGYPIFSPDSQRLFYAAKENGETYYVVVDGEPIKTSYDGIGSNEVIFSPNSQRLAFSATQGNDWYVVVDNEQVWGPYDGIGVGYPIFSPDSQHVAYTVYNDGVWFAVIDGQPQISHGETGNRSLVFSPDSQHVAYSAEENGEWVMVVDEQVEGPYKNVGIDDLVFSPDSQHYAYLAKDENGKWSSLWMANQEEQATVMLVYLFLALTANTWLTRRKRMENGSLS